MKLAQLFENTEARSWYNIENPEIATLEFDQETLSEYVPAEFGRLLRPDTPYEIQFLANEETEGSNVPGVPAQQAASDWDAQGDTAQHSVDVYAYRLLDPRGQVVLTMNAQQAKEVLGDDHIAEIESYALQQYTGAVQSNSEQF